MKDTRNRATYHDAWTSSHSQFTFKNDKRKNISETISERGTAAGCLTYRIKESL